MRKIDAVFSARLWLSATNNVARQQLMIGWFERGELVCVNSLENGWAPKEFKELPYVGQTRFSNTRAVEIAKKMHDTHFGLFKRRRNFKE